MSTKRTVLLLFALTFTLTASTAHAQTITMPVSLGTVGSGLQSTLFSATLSTTQHGGKTVHVESDNPSVVLVANNASTAGAASFDVFVPNGSSSVAFVVSGMEGVTGTATITVSTSGFTSGTRTATIVQPAMDIIGLAASLDTLDPADAFQVRVGLPAVGNGNVNPGQNVRAGGTGFTATLINSNATAGQFITTPVTGQSVTVSITPGNSASPANVASGGVSFDGINVASTTVSASIPGFILTTNASVNVNVTQPTINLNAIGNVGSGLSGTATSIGLSASEHGGITIHVESANPSIAVVAPNATTVGAASIDLVLANGFTATSFIVSGMEGASGASNITVSATGFTGASHLANVQQPAVDIILLATTLDTLDPVDPFQVRIGLPSGGNASVNPAQSIRAGGAPLTATVKLSDGAIGDLITTPLTGDSVVVTIPVGASVSPANVAAGGVAFDGIALGSTTVSATIPGLIATTNALQTVNVTQPTISVSPVGNIGAGLQNAGSTASLSASQHGGVNVHIESANPARALVAPSASTPGTASIDVPVANGGTTASFWVSGVEGATGTSLITASISGFVSGSSTATIVQPGYDVVQLGSSIDTLNPPDAFQVRVGLVASGGGSVNPAQNLRAGAPPLVATIKNSNHPVADLITTALTGDSVVVSIAAGSSASPSNVASGGVSFDGIALGTTTVSATIPGFVATTNANINVTVTQPSIAMSVIGNVGAGLQGNTNNAALSVSNHGGVTVHVASANPSVALVSPNVSTAGTASFDAVIPNNNTLVSFVVHGLENTTGTSNITLSANGFVSATQPVSIVQPALELSQLAIAFDAADPNDPFQVRIGLPTGGNGSINPQQLARVGGSGVTATVILSNGAAGQLVTASTTNDTVTVSIPAGASASAATVAAGGVAFDPVAIGTTLVAATIPGFILTGAATQQLVVSSRAVDLATIGDIGAGLQTGPISATLGLAQHGGVTVHVVSSDPSVALVSPNVSTPGSSSLDFPLANGVTQLSFFVQGLTTGTSTITASVPTFTAGIRTANVVPPALQVALLADTLLDNDANDPFVVKVGVPAGDQAGVATAQLVRAGGATLTATVTCTEVAVAALITNTQNGSPVTVDIPVGESQSAANTLLGGVALDPLMAGSVSVSATIPGFIATAAATHEVYIKPHIPTAATPLPLTLALEQNIPNPFNPLTHIRFTLPDPAHVNLSVFDVRGALVVKLLDTDVPRGTHDQLWNGRDARGESVGSGVYFYRLTTAHDALTRKMVLLK